MQSLLGKMIVLATQKFDGKFDKGGVPYILHCLTVMYKLKSQDQELLCIAVGHDLFEDTDVTHEDLRKLGMTERIIDGIRCLTKVPGETYEEYKAKVKSNHDAILVKMQDLRHNSDIRRLKGVTDKDIKRMIKYHEFYLELKELV